MIGAGIFVLPGPASAVAGPAVVLAFLTGGAIALLTALSASELGTAMPKAGGTYFFVNRALGPVFGSIVGLGNWMGLAFASSFYAIGFGSYATDWVPDATGVSPDWALGLGIVELNMPQIAGLAVAASLMGVNYVGAKETGRLQNIIVFTLVGILGLFVAVGAFHADSSTLTPFFPEGKGMDSVIAATALVFVSYLGFAQITNVAEEIREPGKNLPLAVVGSVVIVTLIYVVVITLMVSIVPWKQLAETEGIAVVDVAGQLMGSVGVLAMTVGGLLATASSANASILASSRINFAMGRDRLMPAWLNEVHETYGTPNRSIAVTGALILAFIFIGDIEILAKAGSILHLIVYGCLNLSLIVMREADPDIYEPDYEVPFYPVVPIVGAILSFGLIAFMAPIEILISSLFVVGGVAWYIAYGRSRTEKRGVLTDYVLKRPVTMPETAVEAAASVQPAGGGYRVMVPLANPEHEKNLLTIAAALAKQRDGKVVAVHIVEVPPQTPLEAGAEHLEELDRSSGKLMEKARRDAETLGIDLETHTILSHRGYDEIFDVARNHRADTVVLGWGGQSLGSPGRVESGLDEFTEELPCDFVVFKDRGYDPDRVLIPTVGGPDSEVSAALASVLIAEHGSQVELLHVVRSESERETGETFLETWADDHGLEEVERTVTVSSEPYRAIAGATERADLLVLGATEQGILRRLSEGSGVSRIVDEVDVSVILAEQARERSLVEWLFGDERE